MFLSLRSIAFIYSTCLISTHFLQYVSCHSSVTRERPQSLFAGEEGEPVDPSDPPHVYDGCKTAAKILDTDFQDRRPRVTAPVVVTALVDKCQFI